MYVRISIARVIADSSKIFPQWKFLLRGILFDIHIFSRQFCLVIERPIKDMGFDNGGSRMLCQSLLWKGLQCHKKGRRQSFIESLNLRLLFHLCLLNSAYYMDHIRIWYTGSTRDNFRNFESKL